MKKRTPKLMRPGLLACTGHTLCTKMHCITSNSRATTRVTTLKNQWWRPKIRDLCLISHQRILERGSCIPQIENQYVQCSVQCASLWASVLAALKQTEIQSDGFLKPRFLSRVARTNILDLGSTELNFRADPLPFSVLLLPQLVS